MSPRKRSPRNHGLPEGLRVRAGYYSYTSPLDGREKGLGRDRAKAIGWARAANVEVQRIRGEVSAAQWVRGESARTWGAWLNVYVDILKERDISHHTRDMYANLGRRARAQWAEHIAIEEIDTGMIADAITAIVKADKRRTAQAYRAYLRDCFRCAIARGWRKDNPVLVTDGVKVKTRRARLTIDHFRAIYNHPETQPWLRNAMALALVSGQRREDIARAQRRDVRDGCWWLEQHKTRTRVAIPVALRLEALGMSLADVLEQCRATGILSRHLIHQTRHGGGSRTGAAIGLSAYTDKFTEAVRRLGIDWQDKSPPTFHEMRSLSKRLYDAQGGVNTKQLLGHRSESAAALYGDGRGEWVRVTITG